MKMNLLLSVLCVIFSFSTSQAQTIVYKANNWGNTKQYNDMWRALDNPILENVVITQTKSLIQVKLGEKILKYKIIEAKKGGDHLTVYKVSMNNKNYSICVSYVFTNGTYAIWCENEWAVANIRSVSSE